MDFEPEIIRSGRRTLSVEISRDLRVIVRAPRHLPEREIARFLVERSGWIESHLEAARRRLALASDTPKLSEEEMRELRRRAMETIPPRVEHYSSLLGVSCEHISYRFQRTRWGSCSSKGNLSFNCLLELWSAGGAGLCRRPRAVPPPAHGPFGTLLGGGGADAARLHGAAHMAA